MNQTPETIEPGIIVRSPSLHVLHMNRRAMALLTQVAHPAQSLGAERALAAPLHPHGQDMLETMQARLGSNNWEQFQHKRVIDESPHSILLNGFGLPDRRGLPHSRIVLLLAPHTPVPRPGISRTESSVAPSERGHVGADRPPAVGLHDAQRDRAATSSLAVDARKLFAWNSGPPGPHTAACAS